MRRKLWALFVAVAAGVLILVSSAPAAREAIPYRWQNCKHVNARWPHGVGRFGAHDKTKSGDPVRNFRRSNLLYRTAMRWNSDLDRDKDKIACEKH
jgi:Excalibur calcium-binding domain